MRYFDYPFKLDSFVIKVLQDEMEDAIYDRNEINLIDKIDESIFDIVEEKTTHSLALKIRENLER